jgi:putative acetyltransferase
VITVRAEHSGDEAGVRRVNLAAFETGMEADLVDALRACAPSYVAFVAVDGDEIVGHVSFTPVTVDGADVGAMALAPLAVLPARQGQGIGSRLTRVGLEHLRDVGCPFVVLVGHASYYPRFGFVPASTLGLTCQWPDVPDDVWLVAVLHPGADAAGRRGGALRARVRRHRVVPSSCRAGAATTPDDETWRGGRGGAGRSLPPL